MRDNKDIESTVATAEPEKKVKTLKVGEVFIFFDKPLESDPSEVLETADILDRSGNSFGGVIGKALKASGKPIDSEDDILRLYFEVRAKAEKPKEMAQKNDPGYEPNLVGFPIAKPMMFATIRKGDEVKIYASMGKASGENTRQIIFTDWLEVKDENKTRAEEKIKFKMPQPLITRKSGLTQIEFKIT